LVNQVLGGSSNCGEADAEAQENLHGDESTGKRLFGKRLFIGRE